MQRVFNFSAGPAILPEAVLQSAAAEMLNYEQTGMSVMEMSHRTRDFEQIIEEAEADLRQLTGMSDDYEVLFLQGGGSMQFAMIPMNLMRNRKADYIHTGNWTKKAIEEARRYGDVKILASSEDEDFSYIPDCSDLPVREDADYVYICENNTVFGTKYHELPDTKGKPLVADLSSCLLSEALDISRYAVIFAGAQKNLGPAGVTVVIIRKDLIADAAFEFTPTMLSFKTHAQAASLYNTPPCYNIYLLGKVLKWIQAIGGLEAMRERNIEKARLLYDFLDRSCLFKATARKRDRSMMNVTFVTGDFELDRKFLTEAQARALVNLGGHRSVGGMRASLYNAMSLEGVEALVSCLEDFERENG